MHNDDGMLHDSIEYPTIEDMVKLLRFRSLTNLTTDYSDLRRAFSEASIPTAVQQPDLSMLKVNQNQVTVGGKVIVSWDIKEPCTVQDWIGLFYEGMK